MSSFSGCFLLSSLLNGTKIIFHNDCETAVKDSKMVNKVLLWE